MRTGRRVGAGLGAASLVWAMTLAVAPTPAGASTALCGSTITVSTTLTEDVGPCSSNGIQLGANNITLNLNGHTVFGTPAVNDGLGIWAQGKTGLTIRGGTVTNFDAGVALISTSNSLITQIVARDNIGEVSEFAETDFGDGILLFGGANSPANGNRVVQNQVTHNGPFDGIGLLGNADNNTIQGNVVQDNNLPNQRTGHAAPSDLVYEDDGIRLETVSQASAPNNNIVTGNTISGSALDGIAVFAFANGNQLISNVIQNNGNLGNLRKGDGIHIFNRAQNTLVTGNRVTQNARNGVRIDGPAQPSEPPGFNVVRSNVIVQNATNPAPDFGYDEYDGSDNCDSNTWASNTHFTELPAQANCLN